MTISSTTRKAGPFSGTGTQNAYPFSFKVFASGDVLVVQTDDTGVENPLAVGTHYTVALNADQEKNPGGIVSLSTALPAGYLLTVSSAIPLTQGASIPNMGGFYPKVIEQALDKLTIAQQQIADVMGRCIRFAFSDAGANGSLPTAGVRAGKFLAFDAGGNPTAATGTGADAALRTDLASSASGSGLIAFVHAGLGVVKRTVLDVLRDQVRIKDYGVVADDATDDTAAIQRAINTVAAAAAFDGNHAAVELIFPSRAKVYIAETLYVPSFVRMNLNGSRLRGTGSNTMFESGYFDGSGNVVSNFGQDNETQFVVCSRIYNGNIYQCNKAFHLFNFCEDSSVDNIRFVGVNQAVYAKRCFYGSFTKLHSRSPLDGTAFPCFHFDDEVNAVTIKSVFAVSYTVGWKFSGAKDGVYASTCGAESCPTGVTVSDATSGIHFHNWYFENNYNAIDCDGTGNHENVVVTSSWFNSVTNALQGVTIVSGEFGASNKLNGAAAVNLASNFANRMEVRIPTDVTADNATPALPAAYLLGDANLVDYVKTLYNSVTGFVSIKGRVHGGVIPHHYSGDSGTPSNNVIPFCTAALNAGADTLTVDTKIRYLNTEFIGVQLTLNDASGAEVIAGICAAGVFLDLTKPAAVSVTPSNNSGFYRFTIAGLTTATSYSGVIRIL